VRTFTDARDAARRFDSNLFNAAAQVEARSLEINPLVLTDGQFVAARLPDHDPMITP